MDRNVSPTTYTPQMLERIISPLNEIYRKDGTKQFQDHILSRGAFHILCPITNKNVYPTYNFLMPHVPAVIYFFEGVERLALISSNLALGNPIVTAITETVTAETDNLKSHPSPASILDAARWELSKLSSSTPKIDPKMKPNLICGHKNFAHFIWNELPTIDNSIFGQRDIERCIMWDPFNIHSTPPYSGKLIPVKSVDAIRGWNSSLVFIGTSTFLFDSVRSRMLRSIIDEKKPEARKLYITVRPQSVSKYLVNQVDFLSSLIRAFLEKYEDMKFVLDGFSMPDDLERSIYKSPIRSRFAERVKQSNLIIDEIIHAVPQAENNIRNITGMCLTAALEIISSCSYYVCHAGTQQHKIGWLFPRGGFLHSNSRGTSDHAIKWLAGKTECAIAPSRPAPEHVEDVSSLHDDINESPGAENSNYKIKDTNSVIRKILEDYRISVKF